MAQTKERERVVLDAEVVERMQSELVEVDSDPVRSAQLAVEAAETRAIALRAASIKQTLPTDWVRHNAPGGDTFCYLMDAGAQRIAGLWGVRFDPTKMSDFEQEIIPDETGQLPSSHINFSIMVTARLQMKIGNRHVEMTRTEIGSRSTSSDLFRKRWESAETTGAQRATMKQDVKKAALTNGMGRLSRALTGMSRMPLADVCKYLNCKPEQIPGVDYKTGGKGGAQQGSGPNDGQLKALTFQAIEKVEGIEKGHFDQTLETLSTSCELSSRDCSQLIDFLKKKEERIPKAEFWKRAKYRKPKADAPPAAAEGEKKPDAGDAKKTDEAKCPGCQRTIEHINDEGHTPECKNPTWGGAK